MEILLSLVCVLRFRYADHRQYKIINDFDCEI